MYEKELAVLERMKESLERLDEVEDDEVVRFSGKGFAPYRTDAFRDIQLDVVPKPMTQSRFRAVLRTIARHLPDREGDYLMRNSQMAVVRVLAPLLGLSQSKMDVVWDLCYFNFRNMGKTERFHVTEEMAKMLRKIRIDLIMVSKCVDCTMDELRVALLERIQVWKELFKPSE